MVWMSVCPSTYFIIDNIERILVAHGTEGAFTKNSYPNLTSQYTLHKAQVAASFQMTER
jgi:hypothetical protein